MRALLLFLILFPLVGSAEPSKCYGTSSNGSLSHGVKLPQSGRNYVGYSLAARIAGRTYVHSEVRKIVVDSYQSLEREQPDKVYKYAETGLKNGGIFKPHKTHQNGLSVDFMTPVTDKNGKSVHLPTNPLNAKKNGHELWRVIFAPELQPALFETKYADYLKANIQFSKKRSWVRHDEHYHVDFEIACE